MEEQQLIQRLKKKEQQAYRELLGIFEDQVVNTCYGFIKQPDEARDVAQEVFIEVFQSMSRFREKSSLKTWIYRISVNKSLDWLRKKNRKKRINLWFQKPVSKEEMASDQATTHHTPLDRLLEKEQERIMEQILNKLPVNQRVAWTLHKLEELPQQEVAEILETTIPAVESLIHRARKNLYKQLDKYNY